MEYFVSIFIGYLIGTINPSYIYGKIRGVDIRKSGSTNAGASNALILFGKAMGIICAILDIAKTCFAIWFVGKLFPDFEAYLAVTGAACIIGHIFPFYMNFKGGKGLACLGGVVLMYGQLFFVIFLAFEILVAVISRYICFVPITASGIMTLVYAIHTGNVVGTVCLFIATLIIWFKHIENIKRIKNGSEMRISYLWNKEKEIKRLKDNGVEK